MSEQLLRHYLGTIANRLGLVEEARRTSYGMHSDQLEAVGEAILARLETPIVKSVYIVHSDAFEHNIACVHDSYPGALTCEHYRLDPDSYIFERDYQR